MPPKQIERIDRDTIRLSDGTLIYSLKKAIKESKKTPRDLKLARKERKTLKNASLGELAWRLRLASTENNPNLKTFWVQYDEPTVAWIAEELERRSALAGGH